MCYHEVMGEVKSVGGDLSNGSVGCGVGPMSQFMIVTVGDNWRELQRLILMDRLIKSNSVACEGDLGRMLRYVQFMVELRQLDSEGVTRCLQFDNLLERVVLGVEQAICKFEGFATDVANFS